MRRTLISRTLWSLSLALACLLFAFALLPSAARADSLAINFSSATVIAGQPVKVTITGTAIAAGASVSITANLGQTQIYSSNLIATVAGSVSFSIVPASAGTLAVNANVIPISKQAVIGANTIAVTDFSLTPDASSLSVAAGGSVSTNITVNAINGFADNVLLDAAVTNPNNHNLPVSGVIIALSVNPVAPNTASKLTITVPGSALAGAYTVTVTGTDGAATRTTTLSLSGVVPDYQLSIDPALVLNPPFIGTGMTQTVTMTVTPLNGYKGVVNLSTVNGTGVTASPAPVSVSLDGTQSPIIAPTV